MARAYAYARGDAPCPTEITLYKATEAFGVSAVFGARQLSAQEIRTLITAKTADAVVRWYREREKAESWAKWQEAHPQETTVLEMAFKEHEAWRQTA